MRILFFLNVLGGGGAEMHFVRLAGELARVGMEPVFVTLRGGGAYEKLLDEGIEHHVLDPSRSGSTVRNLIASIGPLARLIDQIKPDVVCPVLTLTTLPAILAASRATHRAKVVLSIQNALSVEVYEQRTPLALVQRWLIARLWPRVDGIIALSQGVAADIRRYVPHVADRVTVVHNCGKPMDRERARALAALPERPRDRHVLVAVGRLTRQKDYPTMFAALQRVKTQPPPLLRVLGTGDEEAALRALVKDQGLEDQVEFLGFRDDALSHMRVADAFVLSSRWEGFANVIVEAMAMGTAVVATDCPHGPAEIITDEVNGRLVPVQDADALASAIDAVLGDDAERARLAAAGNRRADDFGVEAIAAQYAQAFRAFAGRDASGQGIVQ